MVSFYFREFISHRLILATLAWHFKWLFCWYQNRAGVFPSFLTESFQDRIESKVLPYIRLPLSRIIHFDFIKFSIGWDSKTVSSPAVFFCTLCSETQDCGVGLYKTGYSGSTSWSYVGLCDTWWTLNDSSKVVKGQVYLILFPCLVLIISTGTFTFFFMLNEVNDGLFV